MRIRAAVLAVLLLVLGCVDSTEPVLTPGTGAGLDRATATGVWVPREAEVMVALLHCAPRPAAYASKRIGPLGGTIWFGANVLRVPPGALVWPVTITTFAPSDTLARVELYPEGLRFLIPAELSVSYAGCDQAPAGQLTMAYMSTSLAILSYLTGPSVNSKTQTVTAPLQHFSDYAVAY
ncbi:MAG TPA: hypothetical protein VEV39_14810 [Gemmatimonadales bacterium]|nr:hypothetical protein [Gemmatimonadales bacterium]